MKALIQRVKKARIEIVKQNRFLGVIGKGLVIFLGISPEDNEETIDFMIKKILNLRIFDNSKGKFDLSILDIQGEVLVVSQFTLFADTDKGNRPSFFSAAPPKQAKELYHSFIKKIKHKIPATRSGIFGADMQVLLQNDGPVTLMLES